MPTVNALAFTPFSAQKVSPLSLHLYSAAMCQAFCFSATSWVISEPVEFTTKWALTLEASSANHPQQPEYDPSHVWMMTRLGVPVLPLGRGL